MPDEVRLSRIGEGESLSEIGPARLDLEARLREWLAQDISMLDPGLMVIGREVKTDFGGYIDLLCIDSQGDLAVVELKRDMTPREITAQALDYGSWVLDLSNENVRSIAEAYLGEGNFEEAFRHQFDAEVPETLNSNHSMLVVGSGIDASSERIIKYLSDTYGVDINAATFQYFREPDGSELVSRVFLVEPSALEQSSRTKASKRRPNLTFEELAAMAESSDVSDLYEHAVAAFEGLLLKGRTLSSVVFSGSFHGSRKVVFSLFPDESSAAEGLRHHLYKNRFAELAGLSEDALLELAPAHHDYWIYTRNGGPDEEGFQGFIVSREEIDSLATLLARQQRSGS
jgi:hypothetical protein